MIFSKKITYGIKALLELVPLYPSGQMTVKEIAANHDISKKFLDHVLQLLNKNDIVRSKKGSLGGYYLNHSPGAIRLDEIIKAIDGPILFADCSTRDSDCKSKEDCQVYGLILEAQQKLYEYLSSITLKELYEKPLIKGALDYSI